MSRDSPQGTRLLSGTSNTSTKPQPQGIPTWRGSVSFVSVLSNYYYFSSERLFCVENTPLIHLTSAGAAIRMAGPASTRRLQDQTRTTIEPLRLHHVRQRPQLAAGLPHLLRKHLMRRLLIEDDFYRAGFRDVDLALALPRSQQSITAEPRPWSDSSCLQIAFSVASILRNFIGMNSHAAKVSVAVSLSLSCLLPACQKKKSSPYSLGNKNTNKAMACSHHLTNHMTKTHNPRVSALLNPKDIVKVFLNAGLQTGCSWRVKVALRCA